MSKSASPALIAFMQSGLPFIGADLYTITLVQPYNYTFYVTSLDRNVIWNGQVYTSLGQTAIGAPAIQRSKLSMAVGLEPSKIDLEFFAIPGTKILNQEILVTVAQGLWANASVTVRRAWITAAPWTYNGTSYGPDVPRNWNSPLTTNLGGAGDGTLVWFAGVVGKVTELGPLNCKMEVRDQLWLLNRPLPKNLYGIGCYHTLFDTGCTLSKASYTVTGSVLSGSTTTQILINQSQDMGVPGPPVYGSNPITISSTGYTLPPVQYFVVATYVTALGETAPSAEWTYPGDVPANNVISVASPPSVSGASFWNVYVGNESDEEQLQQSVIPIGTAWHESTNGLSLTGIGPPSFPTNGYWSLGVITITYGSGALSGQSYSGFIETSVWNGSSTTITVRVPFPQVPTTSDSWSAFPGCDKRFSTCGVISTGSGGGKYANGLHGGFFPFVPVPETGA